MIIDKRKKRVKNKSKSSKARKTRVRRTKKSRVNRRNRRTKKTKRNKRVQRGGGEEGRKHFDLRTELEAAQVRLAFAKIFSGSELVDGFEINILTDIGLSLSDELLNVNEIFSKWVKWSRQAQKKYPDTKFPPLSINLGNSDSEPQYNFTFDDLKPGNNYEIVGGAQRGLLEVDNFTFDEVKVENDGMEFFNIKLIKSRGRDWEQGLIQFCADPSNYFYDPQYPWTLELPMLPPYIHSFKLKPS